MNIATISVCIFLSYNAMLIIYAIITVIKEFIYGVQSDIEHN